MKYVAADNYAHKREIETHFKSTSRTMYSSNMRYCIIQNFLSCCNITQIVVVGSPDSFIEFKLCH